MLSFILLCLIAPRIKKNNLLSGVKLLGDYGSLNSMATDYALWPDICLIQIEVVEWESLPIIYLSLIPIIYLCIMDKTVEGSIQM